MRSDGRSVAPHFRVASFWSKVDKSSDPNGCWMWTGSRLPAGYGRARTRLPVSPHSSTELAHRIAWELTNGPIPDALPLDHLCRNPPCVNPEHLEPVTPLENTRRGLSGALRTHCRKGHELTPENTRSFNHRNGRECVACYVERTERRIVTARDNGTIVDGRLVVDVRPEMHGKAWTYQEYGCRCRPCTDAATATVREIKSRRSHAS